MKQKTKTRSKKTSSRMRRTRLNSGTCSISKNREFSPSSRFISAHPLFLLAAAQKPSLHTPVPQQAPPTPSQTKPSAVPIPDAKKPANDARFVRPFFLPSLWLKLTPRLDQARKEEDLLKRTEEVHRLKALKVKELRRKLERIGREGKVEADGAFSSWFGR